MNDFSRRGCPITQLERALLASADDMQEGVEAGWVALMQRIGVDPIIALMDEFGSEKIHVPTRQSFFAALWRARRDAEVVRRLAMKERVVSIASDFGISRALVYVIGKKANEADAVEHRRVVKGGA